MKTFLNHHSIKALSATEFNIHIFSKVHNLRSWRGVLKYPNEQSNCPRWVGIVVLCDVCCRLRTDPAVAVPAGAAVRLVQRQLHHVGGNERGVQADRSRRGGEALGRAQVETQHELWQAEQGAQVSLTFVKLAYFCEPHYFLPVLNSPASSAGINLHSSTRQHGLMLTKVPGSQGKLFTLYFATTNTVACRRKILTHLHDRLFANDHIIISENFI